MDSMGKGLDPLDELSRFLKELRSKGLLAPVCLSTFGSDGMPNGRFVDLKEVLDGTLLFGTDERSVKAREFSERRDVALTGWWEPLQTQIRVRGTVEPASDGVSGRIFAQRGPAAKALASVSVQSAELINAETFRAELTRFLETSGGDIPRPATWHVYAVVPREIEILQFSEDRVHRRTRFVKNAEGWIAAPLYP